MCDIVFKFCQLSVEDHRQTRQQKDILLLAASLTYIPSMYLGKTAVDFHRRWDSRKEGRVGSLEEEISIGHEGEAGAFLAISGADEGRSDEVLASY
jgi:hypothetical protein